MFVAGPPHSHVMVKNIKPTPAIIPKKKKRSKTKGWMKEIGEISGEFYASFIILVMRQLSYYSSIKYFGAFSRRHIVIVLYYISRR